MEYLTEKITDEQLALIVPGKINTITARPGQGKTTFSFDDRLLKLARGNKHIIYLVNNNGLKKVLLEKYKNKSKAFEREGGWFSWRNNQLEWTSEEDEDAIHIMCYQTFNAVLVKEGDMWLDDIDLIIWDEWDDYTSFLESELRKAKKLFPKMTKERMMALFQENNDYSVAAFIWRIKNYVLEKRRTLVVALSATPSIAETQFDYYANKIYEGRIEDGYRAKNTFFIEGLAWMIKNNKLDASRKYWCMTPGTIEDLRRLEILVKQAGFNPISFWSPDGKGGQLYPYTDEQKLALHSLTEYGSIPKEYNFVLTTSYIGRGFNLYDKTWQDWICLDKNYPMTQQFVRGRFDIENQYLLEGAQVEAPTVIPAEYYNWHSLPELRELIKEKPLYYETEIGSYKPYLTWNSFIKDERNAGKFEEKKMGQKKTKYYRLIMEG